MQPTDRSLPLRAALFAGLLAVLAAHPAGAQDVMQLTVPSEDYNLGHFKYQPPKVDGWRQIALAPNTLSLVYAEQTEDQKIETRFGVAMESHEIPAGTPVESAAALAELSRTQMAEARKDDLVALSPIQPVPSIDNFYTYRMLVHPPIKDQPDVYEVYYVMMSPDKKEYLVIQCITKSQTYENEIYFQQLYGSFASLKYVPEGGDKPADAKAGDKPADAKPEDKPAESAPKAESAAPAAPESNPATPPAAH